MSNFQIHWFVDEFLYFREILYVSGWAFHEEHKIKEMGCIFPQESNGNLLLSENNYQKLDGYGLSSVDVQQHNGEQAIDCRFKVRIRVPNPEAAKAIKLVFTLENNQQFEIEKLAEKKRSIDKFHGLFGRFLEILKEQKKGKVLEIGSRNRSGNVRRNLIPESMEYIGMDIKSGDNVDVVGDAHLLTQLFKKNTFDAIFCISVFEHLLMPWKVVLEINQVLKPGGLFMITTHQTWPLHETPWDFWRFSDQCWHGLFNKYTGFEIVDTALGEPGLVVAQLLDIATTNLDLQPACLGSAVLAKKIGNTELNWDVDPKEIIDSIYPC
ncbi:MAG: methyltransferase domain-containing protein [Xenococcaceae cyanobacterium MO_188.B29]|nr:methyltransferase domain-containing protein [Xenococcaceae cyanobacterium MO_188.B29]